MYCGNNRRHIDVRSGLKVIGNRYDCLKKGVAVGQYLPYDPNFATRFVPIDDRKIYCGKSAVLPAEYDILGNNHICFQKGVGVGKSLKAKSVRKKAKAKKKRRSR
jgi:hypothetical protein